MRETELSLSKRDRQTLDGFRSKGMRMVRELNRAHLLAALERKILESQIMEVLGVGRTAIWRTRRAYLQGGLEFALQDVARPGKPKRYRTDEEAEMAALACSDPPAGAKRWTVALLTQAARSHPQMHQISRETIRRFLKKNFLKPWRKLMWCIGQSTSEYRDRMYGLLELYAQPYRKREPVVCIDEKSKQLLKETRSPLPLKPGVLAKQDYEYKRAGTCNLLWPWEPKGARRVVEVTGRRTKVDFVNFVRRLLKEVYAGASTVHLVLDNLNTHFRSSFEEVLGHKTASALLRRVEFHHTRQTCQLA